MKCTAQEEDEANQFAMALLMPEDLVRKEIKRMGGVDLCDDKQIKKLAAVFMVPVALMAIRIGQLMK